jgi:hypothetical protein
MKDNRAKIIGYMTAIAGHKIDCDRRSRITSLNSTIEVSAICVDLQDFNLAIYVSIHSFIFLRECALWHINTTFLVLNELSDIYIYYKYAKLLSQQSLIFPNYNFAC